MRRLPVATAREVCVVLRRAGFVEVPSEGRHRQLRRPEGGGRVTRPVHGGQAVPPGTLPNILRQAELTEDQFKALVGFAQRPARTEG